MDLNNHEDFEEFVRKLSHQMKISPDEVRERWLVAKKEAEERNKGGDMRVITDIFRSLGGKKKAPRPTSASVPPLSSTSSPVPETGNFTSEERRKREFLRRLRSIPLNR